mmetsp:Transcript_32611/g.103915  ORF Transcript_32611/g.103915 Transcript_32611/m.103915 type:complete len:275 (-) Transcript_32611:185-1009(-)|eukprot:CAMPEP_0182892118 /NCGR_PEP_ID=MMETSP0034_2-20130328/23673_1 /TAXON_ID=156128 /ORGANISM="Nephroselmis pyriformis, Strain CCMP717" /LENGTH=274 /DNA_ID=CAMNT_0025025771 /DNA_START=199 /DNA_END=1023 /DNA_ORIENTATION=+
MPPKSSRYRGVTLFRPTGKWRAQISAFGKTTSLGDHDTEEEAARAFDRAAINKGGRNAVTNFEVAEYQHEVEELMGMSQAELVAALRGRARKCNQQTSNYRGVSLLKQTGKWHAQINVGGKQVHLGYFGSEEMAARAYDRAAINKSGRDGQAIQTNFNLVEYKEEWETLETMTQQELLNSLSTSKTITAAEMGERKPLPSSNGLTIGYKDALGKVNGHANGNGLSHANGGGVKRKAANGDIVEAKGWLLKPTREELSQRGKARRTKQMPVRAEA